MEQFPAWRYHKEKEARVFNTAAELAQAGDGWEDSPAKLLEDFKMPEPKEQTAPDTATTPIVPKELPEPAAVKKPEAHRAQPRRSTRKRKKTTPAAKEK